ncbi:MAG: hypothetical protein APR63_08420 [Desulfuromonas sp. SDB]|nr:MAG: hypothetical protein APR63_08420 [Desulfuromonas sp. SDB]
MEQIEKISEIYKVFSDPTRLKIIHLLLGRRHLCVNGITKHLDISQSAVSQHLRILRQADLVHANKHYNFVHYSINRERLAEFNELVTNVLGENFLKN